MFFFERFGQGWVFGRFGQARGPVVSWSLVPWSVVPWSLVLWSRGPLVSWSSGLAVLWSPKLQSQTRKPPDLQPLKATARGNANPPAPPRPATPVRSAAKARVWGLQVKVGTVIHRACFIGIQVAPDDIIVSLLLLVLSRCYTGSFRCDI